MLVDDNQLNLKLTKSMLEKQNFEVKAFDNGYAALEELEKEDFDVILLDIHMPELDGYEITVKIRKSGNSRIKEIPIIALTAAATQNEINKCLECGMNDYIVKPFKKEELVTKLLTLGIDE
jgi:CheY-like chemotaxis protein